MNNQLADDLEAWADNEPPNTFRPGILREAAKRLRAMPTIADDDAALVKRVRRWCFWKDHACKPGRADPNCAPCEAADRLEALTATPRPASLQEHVVIGCACGAFFLGRITATACPSCQRVIDGEPASSEGAE
jgi:hypothetical protein